MTIYGRLIEAGQCGLPFYVDFKKKNLFVNKKCLIKHGVVLEDEDIMDDKDLIQIYENPLDYVKILYENFKNSWGDNRSKYFIAKDSKEMSFEAIIEACSGSLAKARLEGFVLLTILTGEFKWEWGNKWFYQDDGGLILLKEWFY